MAGKQAKILSAQELNQLLQFANTTRNPLRNRVIVLLSAKAGLRAGEIAALTWDMVADAQGRVGRVIELRDCAAKKGSGRLVPIHAELRDALAAWHLCSANSKFVVRSERGGQMTPLSMVVWFNRAFQKVGLKRLLVAFWSANVHHARREARASCRWVLAGRAASRRSPVAQDHREIHRRRYRCATPTCRVDLMGRGSNPATHRGKDRSASPEFAQRDADVRTRSCGPADPPSLLSCRFRQFCCGHSV